MAVLTIKTFGGIAPKVPPRYLADSQAQVALNCPVWNGSLQSLPDTGDSIYTLTKTGTPQTIYRFGQDTASDTSYWLHWTKDVDVARGQIAGDASEWTFFTGDGGPKATYNAIALATGDYPTVSRPLGLPAPSAAATAAANAFNEDEHPATIYLTSAHIAQLTDTYGILISTTEDDAAEYTTINLSGTIDADSVKAAIDAALSTTVTTEVSSGSVRIDTVATGLDAKLFVKFQTGTESDMDGDFSFLGSPNLTATGSSDTEARVVITDAEIGSISTGDVISIKTENGTAFSQATTGTMTATELANFITLYAEGKVTATKYGSCVVLTSGTQGDGASGVITYTRQVAGYTNQELLDSGLEITDPVFLLFALSQAGSTVTELTDSGSEVAAPASVIVTQTHIDAMEGKFLYLEVNGGDPVYIPVPATAYASSLSLLSAYGITVEVFGSVEPFAIVSTNAVGTSTSLTIRGGEYPSKPIYSLQTKEGYIDEDQTTESRVYAYTWVNKESGFEFESAPSPASNTVEVRTGQTVSLSGLESVPTGEYVVTNRRIYRSTNGVFLFVAEIPAANSTYTDDVAAEDLAEELPTMTWSEPPQTLRGLTNLPNGMMAGFSGRDIYFCDPYHPHAWPENYIQTIDYPVVGLGRMDTTLAVLTTGVPYFIQGTHPEAMAVVKSDLEQACVSKRSIVSHAGSVFYAAPDGLMMLSPGGSRIVTESLFSYKQWQEFFNPESIHAYQHDNQYIGFYDNGTTQGGFIYDMRSQNFILHDIYATAGFQDRQRDKLFLAFADRSVKVWGDGAAKDYRWKSKKFTMPKPLSFAWGQLEAESYPMTVSFIADGTVIHSQDVTSRNPFRLPAKVGRDWEVEIEGEYEVFAMSVAHSAAELRDA